MFDNSRGLPWSNGLTKEDAAMNTIIGYKGYPCDGINQREIPIFLHGYHYIYQIPWWYVFMYTGNNYDLLLV